MIEIEFSNKRMEVSIKGHANFDEKGKDIVCSAVSALFYTLVESLELSEPMMRKGSLKKVIREGSSSVSCRPLKNYESHIALIYWTILNGMELMATQYPDCIKFSVRG